MKTSIEISYFPLNEEYKAPIRNFIETLKENEKITVQPNRMSTHIFGEYDEVMQTVTKCMKEAMNLPHSIFMLKVMNLDRS